MPEETRFPIPASLQDLEREPYNLLPYPTDFDDDNEAARADSFCRLVAFIEQGNQTLLNDGLDLFQTNPSSHPSVHEIYDPWMNGERIQSLYTLVRKSTSLAPGTRWELIQALCQSVKILSSLLEGDRNDDGSNEESTQNEETETTQQSSTKTARQNNVVSQEFRDAYACHLYMLFSIMFFMESEARIGSTGNKKTKSSSRAGAKKTGNTSSDSHLDGEDTIKMRAACADAMLTAARSMGENRFTLWKRGVADESVVVLPCRIAYQMLESASGVIARKAASGDIALAMIAATVDSCDSLMGTIIAALMDLMHSFEHLAALCAELCTLVSTNRLGVELIREVGRLDTCGTSGSDSANKASGIKFVAPFVCELALCRPQLVLSNISHLLQHLETEPYYLRSAILTALGHIIEYIGKALKPNHSDSSTVNAVEWEASPGNLQKSSAALLDILQERSLDASSYTRSAVLKAWIRLADSGSIPVERVLPVTRMAIDRLQDKTVMVRKQSLQLLTTLLENNPFMGDLDPRPYKKKLVEMYAFVKENLPASIKEAHEERLAEAKANEESEDSILQLEQATLAAAIAEANSMDGVDELDAIENEFRSKVKALKFSQSALDFIDQFEDASSNLHGMLLSANGSDVTEALRFFVKARHFNLPCAVTGMKQALTLMWSTEQNIKDEVLKSFVDVFIAMPGTNGEDFLPSNQIAMNLLILMKDATASELASIEEAIGCLVKDDRIPAEVFSGLWSATSTAKDSGTRASALHILAMAANADRGIVDSKSRLKIISDHALGDYTEEHRDWKMAYSGALALQRVERAQEDPSCAKYLVLEYIIEQLCTIARGDWCIDNIERDTLQWFSAAEQVIGALFVISPEPEVSCAEIIRGMHYQTLGGSSNVEECHPLRLARFFHVLGHIAMKLLVYTEALSGAVRRANAKKSLKKQEEADKVKQQRKSGNSSSEEDIEAELGMEAELEAENERQVAEIAEKEIVGRGLLSVFGPLLVRVVANEGNRFNSEILRQTSTLALCKFMCVSSSFCEEHLPVIFMALANAPKDDLTLRANTVIALGDLAFRFPNEVRRHTLMVLTHLILNDMIKVKGQVCEIALCLRDPDQRIRDTSRLLFHELSKRSNNPVYNLLPDIISQLSLVDLAKDDFRSILSFLLGYIKKDKQNEMLIEKLCQRFPKCQTMSQKADISYCMTQLKVNERSIKFLVDNFKLYKDALHDDDVKRNFASILSKAKKLAKPELKQGLDEFESKINEQAEVGLENKIAGEKAAKAKARASKRIGRRIPKAIEEEPILESDNESNDESATESEDDDLPKPLTPVDPNKGLARRSTRRSRQVV
eukprot:jgi/Psemu1/298752/fgenesh1_pm.719_\